MNEEEKSMSEQKKLHEPIIKWLQSHDIQVLSDSEKFPVPIKGMFPLQNYIFPDIIGVRGTTQVVVVEVETDMKKMFEAMGKCMLWKVLATYVYVAYPKKNAKIFKVLESFGIGELSVSEDGVDEIIKMLPDDASPYRSLGVVELHPLDMTRELELHNQIKQNLDA